MKNEILNKAGFEKLVKSYMVKASKERATKKNASTALKYMKDVYKKDKLFAFDELIKKIESGSDTFEKLRKDFNFHWRKLQKYSQEKNCSTLNIIASSSMGQATMCLVRDIELMTIELAKRDGHDLLAMSKEFYNLELRTKG